MSINFGDEEIQTLDEYKKNKKKKRSKISIILFSVLIAFVLFIAYQIYIYKIQNNQQYIEAEEVSKQQVYKVFYIDNGYTYDPLYSLKSMTTDLKDKETIIENDSVEYFQKIGENIYGIKENSLFKIFNSELKVLIQEKIKEDVSNFFITQNEKIYYISGDNLYTPTNSYEKSIFDIFEYNEKVYLLDSDYNILVDTGKEIKQVLKIEGAKQFIIYNDDIYYINGNDENKLYVCNLESKEINKIGDDKVMLANNNFSNSSIFIYEDSIYFINESNSNYIYKINRDTNQSEMKVGISTEKVILKDDTLVIKQQKYGLYLYNLKTNFMSIITNTKVEDIDF